MSIYSIIGIIVGATTIAICVIVKIIMRKKRKSLDGVHGFAHQYDPGKTKTDDWPYL